MIISGFFGQNSLGRGLGAKGIDRYVVVVMLEVGGFQSLEEMCPFVREKKSELIYFSIVNSDSKPVLDELGSLVV